ncbi:MAG: hypothetical protein HOO96_25320 [Polyangiaceae bacterium]|nr:hypothetical protein [Polyangiaceae bacterium]
MWHRSSLARHGAALGSIAALLCCSGGTAKADETRAGSIRWDLVVGGSAFFVASYGGIALFGGLAQQCAATADFGGPFATEPVCERGAYPRMFIPFAGPFTYLGEIHSRPLGLLFVADGTLQVAGVAVAIAGLVWRKPPATEALRWTPFVGHRTVGLAGTF